MTQQDSTSRFSARLLFPKTPAEAEPWAFVILPADASAKLPRRGRTSIEGTLNDHRFTARLEPDGKKSHWLRVDEVLLRASGAKNGDVVELEIRAVSREPEPNVPADFLDALHQTSAALTTWEATTTLARVDWIHWITSAKQIRTRAKRIRDACEMLAEGKKRVCCFDSSGFYSKAFGAPEAMD